MSLKTKFRTTETLLCERAALHQMIDALWQCGDYTRSEVYELIARALGSSVSVHVSDLSHEDLLTVASFFKIKYEHLTAGKFCTNCKWSNSSTSIGIPICSKTGYTFFETLNKDMPLQVCKEYKNENSP